MEGMLARITPYELILEPLEHELFPAIRTEAEQRGSDARRCSEFLLLGHVGAALRAMVPEDAPPEALDEYGELLYHGFQFWAFGRRLYVLEDDLMRHLTEPEQEMPPWELAGPPACYVQFSYQRLWARVAPDAPYEPADGCFIVVDDTAPAPDAGAHLRVVLALGMRPDRPGISLVSYRTDLDPRAAARHARSPSREEGTPFASTIPGGDRKGLCTLINTSELEALVLRALRWLDEHPERLEPQPGAATDGLSRLPHVIARLGD